MKINSNRWGRGSVMPGLAVSGRILYHYVQNVATESRSTAADAQFPRGKEGIGRALAVAIRLLQKTSTDEVCFLEICECGDNFFAFAS
jgi:hypothetical protein